MYLAEHAQGCVRVEVPAGATLFIPGEYSLLLIFTFSLPYHATADLVNPFLWIIEVVMPAAD